MNKPTPRESFEAFCIIQQNRIAQTLHNRYGREVYEDGADGARANLMPQNDHMVRVGVLREADIERRR